MRNLKKFLALVMAMVMAFSLMISASAAEVKPSTNFSDNDGITEAFVEAVDVLGGMKVYKGDDTGTLRPGSTITRAEVAALIYRLATGDVDDVRAGLYANYGNFADVNENDWFAGYVGYCANAGYIKGHGGYFNPYDSVTGYETLAMILRAIGYDKNHEFEGATWQTNVSALGTQLGILDDIKTTDYANTLHLASRRDVVASILFRAAAYVPMVNYTALSGYDKWTNLVSKELNPTLGFKLFGLTNADGIVVGNQETGESNTKFRFERDDINDTKDKDGIIKEPVKIAYVDNDTVSLKMETGLLEFGHKFNVWFDDTGRVNTGTKTVYTAYDKVVKSELVAINTDNATPFAEITTTGTSASLTSTNEYELGPVAKKAGFSVGDSAFWSDSFKTITDDVDSSANTAKDHAGSWFNDQGLYLLVSNSSNKALDLVISVNVEATKITRVDNVSATKSITVPTNDISNTTFIDNTDNKGKVSASLPLDKNSDTLLEDSDADDYAWIKQGALTGNSSTTLGDYVITTAIGIENKQNTYTASEIEGYQTHSIIKNVKEGQVVNYKTDAATVKDVNFNKDYVQLADGTKIEKSLLYYTVPGTESDPNEVSGACDKSAVIPQVYNTVGGDDAERYTNGTYRFYLDEHGRYVGAEPVIGTEFLYGTYADYSQATSSSTFKYYMTGVNLQGEIVTKEFSTLNNNPMLAKTLSDTNTFFHDFEFGTIVGVGSNDDKYNGFMVVGSGLYDDTTPLPNTLTLAPDNQGVHKLIGDDEITVDKGSINVGAVKATDGADIDIVGASSLFLTEKTKFIVVSGTGTDTVKAETFNGLTDFLGTSAEVNIAKHDNSADDANRSDTYYTVEKTPYANVEGRYAYQIDTIIINSRDIERLGGGNFYFTPSFTQTNPDPVLVDMNDPTLKLYNVYVGAELKQIWLDTAPTTGTFYRTLKSTAKVTTTGDPVYQLDNVVAPGNAGSAWVTGAAGTIEGTGQAALRRYTATSRDSQTAFISTDSGNMLVNVANAKVVNLNPTKFPNLNTLQDLNELASNPVTGDKLRVWATFTSDTSKVVDVIYVARIDA